MAVPAFIPKEYRNKARNGVGIFLVSTGLGFEFDVSMMEGEDGSNCFTLDVKRGDGEPVVINNGEKIYYSGSCTIDGMKTGEASKFMQYVPSQKESTSLDKNSDKGTFHFKLTPYKRIRKYTHYEENTFRGSSSGYSYGMTVSSGQHSEHINTSVTDDTFEPTGESVNILVQLISNETQEELEYQNKRNAEHKLDVIEDTLCENKRKLKELQELVNQQEAEIARAKNTLLLLSNKAEKSNDDKPNQTKNSVTSLDDMMKELI